MGKRESKRERPESQEKERTHTQLILDSIPYRIMVVNLDMIVNTVNQTFLNEFNLTYEDVLGKPCHQVRYGLDRPCEFFGRPCHIRQHLDEIREKKSISIYNEYLDDHGETRFDVITIAPIYNKDGEVIQVVETSRDVTERIRLEQEALRSNTFFQNMIQSTVDGIVVADTKGKVLIWNQGMERLTGYSDEEMTERGHLSSFYDIDVAKENMRKIEFSA